MDDKRMPTMWKLFLGIMASGLVIGVVSPLVAFAFAGTWPGGRGSYVTVSVALGLAYALGIYAMVKGVLRAFVRKLHTLERVVAGTTPPELPGVWTSNEMDEVERSAARIVAKLDAARAESER